MRILGSLRLLSIILLLTISVISSAADSAADKRKAVLDYQEQLYKEAVAKSQDDGSKIDEAAIRKLVKQKALDAIKDVDPAKADPVDGLDWGVLFNLADKPKESQTLLHMYVGTKAEPEKLYEAQVLLLQVSMENGDQKSAAVALTQLKPYDTASSLGLAGLVVQYAPSFSTILGPEATATLVDDSIGRIKPDQLGPAVQRRYSALKEGATIDKIEIWRSAGQKDRALAVIDEASKDSNEAMKARLNSEKALLTMVGEPAPALKLDRGYGKFPGLEALKGKVILIDFFAHWCEPCTAEFADIKSMLKDLQPKGLEVVGVTTYYGFYGDPDKALTPDEEYSKMADFVKEKQIDWPIAFGPQDNLSAYGVTAMPKLVLIDQQGKVRAFSVGYSTTAFADFRKEIEALLEKK